MLSSYYFTKFQHRLKLSFSFHYTSLPIICECDATNTYGVSKRTIVPHLIRLLSDENAKIILGADSLSVS